MGISSLGVGSGLDIQGIIAGLMSAERQQKLVPLQTQEGRFSQKLSLYTKMRSEFSSFKDAVTDVRRAFDAFKTAQTAVYTPPETDANGNPRFIAGRSIQNSNPGVATITGDPGVGNYTLDISSYQPSTRQSYFVSGIANANNVYGSGTITVDFGTDDGAGNFTADGARQLSFDMAPGSSAQQVIDKFNARAEAAGEGVRASFNSIEQRIEFVGEEGDSNNFRISVASTDGLQNLQNNGASIGRASTGVISATVTDDLGNTSSLTQSGRDFVLGGLTFTANGAGVTTVDVSENQVENPAFVDPGESAADKAVRDGTTLQSKIDAFVKAYNSLSENLRDNQGKGKILGRDGTPRQLEFAIRDVFNRSFSGETRVALGFSIDKEAKLTFDKEKFSATLESDPTKIENVLDNGFMAAFETFATNQTREGGLLFTKIESLNTRIERVQKDKLKVEARLGTIELRFTKQFTALDRAIVELQSSATFLGGGLASSFSV